MINHVRTLLLNRGRDGHNVQEPGEEYIPAEFRPRALTLPLRLVQTVLFGNQPDRLFLNYRMRQLMQLMHATPMAEDILADDSRITYLPFKEDLFDDAFQLVFTLVSDTAQRVHVAGTHTATPANSITQQIWDVEVTDWNEAVVTKRTGRRQTELADISHDKPVALPGSELKLYLHGAAPGYKLQVSSTVRPPLDLSQILSSVQNSLGENITEIFPTLPTGPLVTWKRIWLDHPMFAMRFTALLLAIAYRTGQLPQETANG